MTNTYGFLLSAGLGTRLQPLTNYKPKALVEVNGISLLERNIYKLKSMGISVIVVNVFHFADLIIDFLVSKDWGVEIRVSDERPEVLETGGGLRYARPLLEDADDVLIWNVDILSDINVESAYLKHKENKAIATLLVSDRESSRKLLWKNDQLVGWKNVNQKDYRWVKKPKDSYTALAFSGIHFVNKELFKHFVHTGKFSIIETYFDLAKRFDVQCYDHTGIEIYDVGSIEKLHVAEEVFG